MTDAAADALVAARARTRRSAGRLVSAAGMPLLFAASMFGTVLIHRDFGSYDIQSLALGALPLAMAAAAQSIVVISGGIDIGTKRQIYALLREIAASGASVLLFTSELPEIRLACDRAIVLFGGRISGEMPAGEASEARLLRAAHGLTHENAEALA